MLRGVQRLGDAVHDPDFYAQDGDATDALSRWHACPRWIVKLWLDAYGPDATLGLLKAQAEAPPVGLRVNLTRPGAEELLERLAAHPDCLFHARETVAFAAGRLPTSILGADAVAQGLVSRQSAASQQALTALEPSSWPTPVWDCCCGSGGKLLALAEQGFGPLIGSDPSVARLRRIPAEAERLGLQAPPVFRAFADHSAPLRTPPSTVLVDAPCSGLGVLARRPDSKWKRTPADVTRLVYTQRRILDARWRSLPSGGVLTYVTCTANPAENQAQMQRLVEQGAGLEAEVEPPFDSPLGEFFYAARLRKP